MIGAGIYVLVGEILAISGTFAPWAFALAAVVAGFTARTYGELATRFPRSAGEAVYSAAVGDCADTLCPTSLRSSQ